MEKPSLTEIIGMISSDELDSLISCWFKLLCIIILSTTSESFITLSKLFSMLR